MEKLIKLLGFTVILSSLGIISSCSKEDVDEGTPSLEISTETLSVAKEGGNSTFVVTTNRDWTTSVTYSTGADWVALTPSTGKKGETTVTVTCLPNTGNDRTATIKVATSTIYEYVQVQQAAGITKTYVTCTQLRSMGEGTVASNVYMKASMISDQVGGNSTSLKNIVVSDGGAGFTVRLTDNASTYAVGAELEFNLKDATLSRYNGLLQLNIDNSKVTATGQTVAINPSVITAAQLLSGNYESMYVSVTNVQVVEADLTKNIASADAHTTINMESSTGENFSMFSAKYSEFVGVAVPQGSGSLKGIASVNSGTIQVTPRNRTDFAGLTGTRFPSSAKLTYGTASLAGALNKDAATTATITLPYTNAKVNDSYSLSIAVSGAGAAGLTTPVTATGTFAAAAGNIVFTLSGTPTAIGAVVFTITGTGITTPIVVNGTVVDAANAQTLASWTFTAVPTMPMASTSASTDASTDASLDMNGFTTAPTFGYTSSSATIYANNWGPNQSWLFSMTPKAAIAAGKVVSISYYGYGSNTSPKDFVAEFSSDNTTWHQMGDAIVYTSSMPTSPFIRTYTLAAATTGKVYFRIKCTSTTSIGGGTVGSGGNSRLANVIITVQ
ncbi:MAG: DUF5689 domain-containing protein [Bacteroidales bacterium]|nr:DUF5689 domain-containing protein [Bacteroidales bacterium]